MQGQLLWWRGNTDSITLVDRSITLLTCLNEPANDVINKKTNQLSEPSVECDRCKLISSLGMINA